MKSLIERSLYQPAIVLPILMLVRLMTALDFSITQIALVLAFRGTRYIFNLIADRVRAVSRVSSRASTNATSPEPQRASSAVVVDFAAKTTASARSPVSTAKTAMPVRAVACVVRTALPVRTVAAVAKTALPVLAVSPAAKTNTAPAGKKGQRPCHC
ncbi:protein of unknown function [Pararobbsia alpina]|uniref:hypothetical protein n=1 Tax=Pararobbsia alpina TaxID=621374 RepID=UPI0039A4854D